MLLLLLLFIFNFKNLKQYRACLKQLFFLTVKDTFQNKINILISAQKKFVFFLLIIKQL